MYALPLVGDWSPLWKVLQPKDVSGVKSRGSDLDASFLFLRGGLCGSGHGNASRNSHLASDDNATAHESQPAVRFGRESKSAFFISELYSLVLTWQDGRPI